jgi:hypothetical protein
MAKILFYISNDVYSIILFKKKNNVPIYLLHKIMYCCTDSWMQNMGIKKKRKLKVLTTIHRKGGDEEDNKDKNEFTNFSHTSFFF